MIHLLDSKQLEVLSAVRPSGSRIFVEGGPGTGKTTTALAAARDLLENSMLDRHSRALFVTFSRSAVEQIASTMRQFETTIDERIEIVTLDGLALRIISGFGRYHGCGTQRPRIQSRASNKVGQINPSRYKYEDLIPLAATLLKESNTLLNLIRSRWCLVVCDEFQDIAEEQFDFLQLICGDRLLLLGDRNQHIYGWRDVDIRQFDRTKSRCDIVIHFDDGSYRDPSLQFPRFASAFRQGSPIGQQVAALVNSGRLRIERVSDDIVEEAACRLAVSESSSSQVAIFARHIETVTSLGEWLRASNVAFETAGTSEVYAEALQAMLTLYMLGLGRKTIEELGLAFASVCASLYRGEHVPEVCRELTTDDRSATIRLHYITMKEALTTKVGSRVGDIVQLVTSSWHSLNLGMAADQWERAAREFRRCAEPLSDESYTEETVDALEMAVESSRNLHLLHSQFGRTPSITLMTYNQSKGREFDVVIHVHKHKCDDYWGRPAARDESLRLLGVAISRTRQKLVVVMSTTPHDLVRPLIA